MKLLSVITITKFQTSSGLKVMFGIVHMLWGCIIIINIITIIVILLLLLLLIIIIKRASYLL